MHIRTIEEDYEYRMKKIMKKFMADYGEEFKGLSADEVQGKMWTDFSSRFGKMVLEDMYDFAGEEYFELEESEDD